MRILVTGGTGFIGKALVEQLLKDNEVFVVSRGKKKHDNWLKGSVQVFYGDIQDLSFLRTLPQNIDIIFHLAASLDYFGDIQKLRKVNVQGTKKLYEWAIESNVKKFIFTSSIEAMALAEAGEIVDESHICAPLSSYGQSKFEAEKLLEKKSKDTSIVTMIIRLGNVYGPGSSFLILDLAKAIMSETNLIQFLPVYGDFHLSPVFIDDIVGGLTSLLKTDKSDTYILTGKSYSIRNMVDLISSELKYFPKKKKQGIFDEQYLRIRKNVYRFFKKADLITYFMLGEGRRVHRSYDVGKARGYLKYDPEIDLEEGIVKTLEWAKRKKLL